MKFEELFGDYKIFLNRVFANLESLGIDIKDLKIDHIAFRTTTKQDYDQYVKRANKIGKLSGEILIRNRSIGVWCLDKPLVFKNFTIPYLEIMAPAQGDRHFDNVLEHAELVVPIKLFKFKEKYPQVEFNIKNFDRVINPELILLFPNDANVKFHELPIDKVIELERTEGLIKV